MTQIQNLGEGRVRIPLVMLAGNMEVLLNNNVPVSHISFKDGGPNGLILMVGFADDVQEAAAKELGFRTTREKKQ